MHLVWRTKFTSSHAEFMCVDVKVIYDSVDRDVQPSVVRAI